VAHGDQDTFVPVAGARLFVEELRSTSSNPIVYAELPGAQHSFDLFHSLRFETVVDGIEGLRRLGAVDEGGLSPEPPGQQEVVGVAAPSGRPPTCVYCRPCSKAPFTPASSAFSRYSASASAERKPRPGSDSAP